MEFWDAIHLAALRDVYFAKTDREGGDPLYVYRKIFRWYSKNFYTPLHLVQELPLEDVLRAWYEQTFEDMEDKDLEAEVRKAALSDEELRLQEMGESADAAADLDLMREAEEENAAYERAALAKRIEDVVRPVQEQLQQMVPIRPIRDVEIVPARPPNIRSTIPPDIKMTFVPEDDDSFEKALEGDAFDLLAAPKKKGQS